MEDKDIIELYFSRNEAAIEETKQKYGGLCYRIAYNILSIHEDSEECVSDTYMNVWGTIPPSRPENFRAFICRITRNISINRYRRLHSQKRYNGMDTMLSELNDCVPSADNTEKEVEAKQLSEYISNWLDSLDDENCALFVRRYWFGESVKELAGRRGVSAERTAQRMLRLRKSLKKYLEQRGVVI